MEYNVDFFIDKFSKIPERKWIIGSYGSNDDGPHCAYGHCGARDIPFYIGNEAMALAKLFVGKLQPHEVNDGKDPVYQQPTPKERILAALYDIKQSQQPKELPLPEFQSISLSKILQEETKLIGAS